MYAVCTTDAGCSLELYGATAQHLQHLLDIVEKDGVSLTQQVAIGRIYNVGTRKAVVHPLALLTESLAHGTREGDDIVAGLLLNLGDTVNIKRRILPELLDILLGYYAELAPRLRSQNLNTQVGIKLVLLGPHLAHDLSTISFNHKAG